MKVYLPPTRTNLSQEDIINSIHTINEKNCFKFQYKWLINLN